MTDQDSFLEVVQQTGLADRLRIDELLSKHTSFRIGGPADFFTVAESREELCHWVKMASEQEVPFLVLGRGTNLLVADEGYRGLVIENRCSGYELDIASHTVVAESGLPVARLSRIAAEQGEAGLEWAIGIPGTVGGAIINNAGAYDGDMAAVVRRVTVLYPEDDVRHLGPQELGWGYRTSRFRNREARHEIILSSKLQLQPRAPEVLKERMNDFREQRLASSPSEPSAGSVFKNPATTSAAELIDRAGLRGKSIGDARISEKHANYIVNVGHARAQDVLLLIALIKDQVRRLFGVELELEIEIIGVSEQSLVY